MVITMNNLEDELTIKGQIIILATILILQKVTRFKQSGRQLSISMQMIAPIESSCKSIMCK